MRKYMEPQDFNEFCAPKVLWHDRMIRLNSSVSLRVISFEPAANPHPVQIVMLPGLTSVMLSFGHLLKNLTARFILHYVETREKRSSIVPEDASFDIPSIAEDIINVVSKLKLSEGQFVLFGASFNATAVIHCCSGLKIKPLGLILLEPNAVFDYPEWGLFLIRLSEKCNSLLSGILKKTPNCEKDRSVLKPLAKWYIRNFRVNKKEDLEMYRISSRALDSACPHKLRKTILSISSYQIWNRLSEVRVASLLICASRDRFHRHADILRISGILYRCTCLDLKVHKRINSVELGQHIRRYIEQPGTVH